VSYTAELMQALLPDRDVLEKKAKSGVTSAIAASESVLGNKPLEPGQAGKGRSSDNSQGYSEIQRRALDKMMAPAAGGTQEREPRKTYND